MNSKDKLTEATMLALQGKLKLKENNEDIEDVTPKECYVEFGRKIKKIINQIWYNDNLFISSDFTRKANILTLHTPQSHLINKEDCLTYIMKKTNYPDLLKHLKYNSFRDGNDNDGKKLKAAQDYINSQFIPALKSYMDSHYKEYIPKIKEGFEHCNIVIEDVQAKPSVEELSDYEIGNLAEYISDFVDYGDTSQFLSFPYQYKYTITIDINNEENLKNIKADIINQRNRKKHREDQKVIRKQKEQDNQQAYMSYYNDSSKENERNNFIGLLGKVKDEIAEEDYDFRAKDMQIRFTEKGLEIFYETQESLGKSYYINDLCAQIRTAARSAYKQLNMTATIPAELNVWDRSGYDTPTTKKFILH